MPNFTTEDLLLFMYNDEMSDLDKTALEQQLKNNWALRQKLQVLKESEQSLQKLKLQAPRTETINAIMEYAAQSQEPGGDGPAVEYLWMKGE